MNALVSAVEKDRKLIFVAHDYICKNPETGYREWKTHEYLKNEFIRLGYEPVCA